MVQPGFGGALDTPRTNLGDATFLSRAPDFADISQELSFQSPAKDGNLVQQLRNGRSGAMTLGTPRGRGPLADRRNLPASVGGAEFTPLLKSATRNSVRRRGKENGVAAAVPNTPALDRIDEDDMTPVPRMDTSVYLGSRNQSYLDNTLPQVDDNSSVASTPTALRLRRGEDKGPLQDGNQLSLREQENVIDRIEKENFGLKLKIHFLEEALRKAGPGFSEAALKENTELKVDKITMERELHRYKKHLTNAERDLEAYRQQMVELQERAKRKHLDENQRAELEKLRKALEEREADVDELQRQLDRSHHDQGEVDKLRDNMEDMEADLRDKERLVTERDDELEELRDKLDEAQAKAKESQRRALELQEAQQHSGELQEAKATIEELEQTVRRLEEQLDEATEKVEEAASERERAERDLEELQEEMADKSVVTKGLSRQIEEKVARLQDELDRSGKEYAELEKQLARSNEQNAQLQGTVGELRQRRKELEQGKESEADRIQELEAELVAVADDRDLLQSRCDTLTGQSSTLEEKIARLEAQVAELEKSLSQEREYALEADKDLRSQYQREMERLNGQVSYLQAEVREKTNLYDNDSEKWENERQTLESERARAEEKAAGLQRTIDRLREAEGNLSSKESKLKEAIESETQRHKGEEAVMTRQIDDLQDALEARQTLLTALRSELSAVRDELRQTQIDYQSQVNRVVALENEVEVLQAKAGARPTQELDAAERECQQLRSQVDELRRAAESTRAEQPAESAARLKWQLSDATSQLGRANRDRQSLEDRVAALDADLHSARASLAEARAERDELDGQLRRQSAHDKGARQLDQERLDLRAAKLKLDNEVRRLKEENRALADQRAAAEKTLDDEIDKAAAEEERLGQEILALQARLRQCSSSGSQELAAARRTMRELQRRIDDQQQEGRAAGGGGGGGGAPDEAADGGSSDLSMARRDLDAARHKELELLQRDAAHREVVRGLKRQMADLERQLHDREASRLMRSPGESSPSEPLDGGGGEADKRAMLELQRQLSDLEDQKLVLEEVLEEARQQAEDMSSRHDEVMGRMKLKLDKAQRERDAAAAAAAAAAASSRAADGGGGKHGRHLRRSQAEAEDLRHDVVQQQELIDGLAASEAALRRKLERARSERAAYRLAAEKLQRDMGRLASPPPPAKQRGGGGGGTDEALETVVRAAEGAEERHRRELRGMVMQMEWMQARWEREASMRSDAAYAKSFLQLQLDVANACNKAQLRELEHIRTKLLGSRKPLAQPAAGGGPRRAPSPRPLFIAARFIARMRIAARAWAGHEAVRRKLVAASEELRRVKRARQLRVVRVADGG